MHFHFTEEDRLTHVRGAEIRAALVYERHRVTRGPVGAPAPEGTDVWFHGLGVHGQPPLSADIVHPLVASSARVVLFQLCDHPTMSFDRIPDSLAERAELFLRNHWPKDTKDLPTAFRDRVGFLPPMLKAMRSHPGNGLAMRSIDSIFFGTRTGFSNMEGGKNAREETVRILRNSGLPYMGGITSHAEARYATASELLVPRVKGTMHARMLADSKFCIAPWGNHPLTYRLFEGLALRCLVIAQSIRDAAYLDGGLEAGKHYVEVASDLSDLTELVRHYSERLDEAQRIADAGHAHFRRHFMGRGKMISSWIFDASVTSWRGMYRPTSVRGPSTLIRSAAARLVPAHF